MTQSLERLAPYVLSIMRIMVALLFFEHGSAKLFGFPQQQPTPPPELFSFIWFSGAIEFVGGALAAVGLFTRAAAFIMSGEMAVGYFMMHAPQGFWPLVNKGESAILFCFVFLYLAAAGAGAWSIDEARTRNAPIR